MNRKNKRMYSRISKRLFTRYLLSFLVLLVVLFGGYFTAWFICSRMKWYSNSPLYNMLKILQYAAPMIIVLFIISGIILFTGLAIRRALRYLDEVIDAAKLLSNPSEEPVVLSAELLDVQNELNLAREQSLRNARAAKEAEQRKNDLVIYLAHDLKTPLTSVIGYLTLLAEEPQISTELRARYTGIALQKAQRLEELINEFFEITRFNLTSISLEMERTNLTRMLEQVCSEFEPSLKEKELSLRMEISPDVEILCDRDKLSRVFDNLLRNAVNYSYYGSEIFLGMERGESVVRIFVVNQGKTIPKDKLSRVFEQFFRMDSSRSSRTGGSGLGLAIAKEIVELHGGKIYAESENETFTLTVFLPEH